MLNSLKNWFLFRLIRVLNNHFEPTQKSTETVWWMPNYCEPTVQVVLRDLCRPGDVVFDVGANFGHLSVLLSRLVGPRGTVCAFEASPRNLEPLQKNLVRNGCFNARAIHAAVSAQSGSQVGFVYGEHPGADRLGTDDDKTPPDVKVPELALDDFVEHFKLEPRIVKMDIEGAEYAALRGFRRSIERLRPLVLLETSVGFRQGIKFLLSLNYRVIDVCDYREVQSETDFPPGVSVSNVLCLPAEIKLPGYEAPLVVTLVQTLESFQFRQSENRLVESISPVDMSPGRYVFEIEFDAAGETNRFACGMRESGTTVLKYEASTSWIRDSYRHWTWHCLRPSKVEFFFEFLNGTRDPTFKLHRVKISRVTNMVQSWMASM